MKKQTIAFLSVFLFQLLGEAKLYGPKRFDSDGLLFFAGAEYFQSKENFDDNAKPKSLPSGNQYMLLDVPVGARYLILPNWAVEGEVKAGYAQSKSNDILFGGNRTNSNLHQARISTDFLFELGNFDLIPELEGTFAFKNIDKNTDTVMMDDGVATFAGKLHAQTEFGAAEMFGYLGYEARGDGRSGLLSWSAGLAFNTQSQTFGARAFGFQSITDDKDKKTPGLRESLINKVNGGSAKFYSVNPSVISVEGLWTFKAQSGWGLQGHLGLDVMGENYAKGFFAGINFLMDIGTNNFTNRSRPSRVDRQQHKKESITVDPSSSGFQEDIQDSKDQQYFAPAPKPRPQPARRAKPSAPSDQQLKNQMDDVEMQIELKRKKRK